MRKLILSALTLVFAAALVTAGTVAFFSDTETSTGNSFAAGTLDLHVANEAGAESQGDFTTGAVTWATNNVTNQLVFDFADLSPGDMGSVKTTLTPQGNDAWMCSATEVTASSENGLTEPEEASGDTTGGSTGGELASFMEFAFWSDLNANGSYDTGEPVTADFPVGAVGDVNEGTLVDFDEPYLADSPATADTAYSVGTVWCFGDLVVDEGTDTFTCDGSGASFDDFNTAQTDTVEGTVHFFAVQSDNNDSFDCSTWTATL